MTQERLQQEWHDEEVLEPHKDWAGRDCDCDMELVDCWRCGGEGSFDDYEDDPLWFDPGDRSSCDICEGRGAFRLCWNRVKPGEPRD